MASNNHKKRDFKTRSSTPSNTSSLVKEAVSLFLRKSAPQLRQMEPYKLAKLYDASGDVKKRWYVYYYLLNSNNEYVRQREFISQKIKKRGDRYAVADEMKNIINKLLVSGELVLKDKKQQILQTEIPEIVEGINESLSILENKLGDGSYKHYRAAGKRLIRHLEKIGILLRVNDFNEKMAARYMTKEYEKVRPKTYNSAIAYLNTIFDQINELYDVQNPFKAVKRKKESENETVVWPLADVVAFFTYCSNNEKGLYAFSLLIFQSYLRLADILRLQKKHLSQLHNNVLFIAGDDTKNSKTRAVTISNELKNILIKLSENMQKGDFVFSDKFIPGSKKWVQNRVFEYFNGVKENLKLSEECTLYKLKHTGNTIADQVLKIDRREIQIQNRHSSLSQTEEYIGKLSHRANESFVNFPGIEELKKLSKQ